MMGRVIVLDEGDRLSFAGSLPDALEHAISSMGTVYEEVTGISHQTELEQRKAIIAARDKEIADLQAIANRPLDGDMNTLIGRCEKREPLSLADQRELWAWLEERGATIGDLQDDFEAASKNAITTRCFDWKEKYETAMTNYNYGHGEIECACGGELALEVREAVLRRRRKIDWNRELYASDRPEIVCLCGSTRFIDAYNEARKRHTYQGRIVLSIEIVTSQSRKEDPQYSNPELKAMLDKLHLRKIEMADFIEVLNVDGYIGESTRNEIEYCRTIGRRIEYLVPIEAAQATKGESHG